VPTLLKWHAGPVDVYKVSFNPILAEFCGLQITWQDTASRPVLDTQLCFRSWFDASYRQLKILQARILRRVRILFSKNAFYNDLRWLSKV